MYCCCCCRRLLRHIRHFCFRFSVLLTHLMLSCNCQPAFISFCTWPLRKWWMKVSLCYFVGLHNEFSWLPTIWHFYHCAVSIFCTVTCPTYLTLSCKKFVTGLFMYACLLGMVHLVCVDQCPHFISSFSLIWILNVCKLLPYLKSKY